MKVALCISLLSVAAVSARAEAQVLCALGSAETPYNSMVDMPPSAGAQGELKKVKALLCAKSCGKVFLFANATTPNTLTVTDGSGASKIAYSPSFLSSVQKTFGPVATLGLVAHELGHHIDATTNRAAWMKESWDGELRADAWAGCALAKAELKPSGLQAALLAMWTYPSASHPPWSARRPAISAGFVQCGGRTLPPLSKEEGEKTAAGDDKKEEAAAGQAGPAGCRGDRDCRNGRACINKRCGLPPARRRCGKDTDCPEPDECGSAGFCEGPAGQLRAERGERGERGERAERGEDEASKPAPKAETLAALQEHHQAPAAAPTAKDVAGCQRSCDEVRNQCVEAATGEVSRCLSTIQSDPTYRACSCPNYPTGNYSCYRFCSSSYEQGKSCSGAEQIRACRSDGERCRSQCQ
jgi:hypothetical protein